MVRTLPLICLLPGRLMEAVDVVEHTSFHLFHHLGVLFPKRPDPDLHKLGHILVSVTELSQFLKVFFLHHLRCDQQLTIGLPVGGNRES